MRYLSRNAKNWSKGIYTRFFRVWKKEFLSFNGLFDKNKLISHFGLRWRSYAIWYDSLLMTGQKVNISRL